MNTNDLLLRWSNMTLDQIEEEIREGKDRESVEQLLGPQTVAEMQAVSFASPSRGAADPVVLLPGIMGSDLSSIRGVTTLVWINPLIFLHGNARYLSLAESGDRDGCPEVEMVPVGLNKLYYLKMALSLNKAAELYEFPYDWRRPIAYNADVLHNSLERWADGSDRKFNLVAHSMGGLVSRAYMARHPEAAEKRVRQLIMMGTPNFGATNAVETLFNGNSLMDTVNGLNRSNDMKTVVRGLPGAYNLLPVPPELYPAGMPYPADWNIYDAASWRTAGIRQEFLDSTRDLHALLAKSDPQLPLTMIAGCHLETPVRLTSDFSVESMPRLVVERIAEGEEGGDGTVPLWSALLPAAQTFYVQEKHSEIPGNRKVIQSVLRLIQGDACELASALPKPLIFPGLAFGVDQPPTPEELRERIRSGTAGKDDLRAFHFAL